MQKFAIIEELENLATANDWYFLLGAADYANIPELDMKAKKYVLWANFDGVPTRAAAGGVTQQIDYIGELALLAKFDDAGTYSSLDETIKQKHDRRLKELPGLLDDTIKVFVCSNRLTVAAERWEFLYNIFDTNFDGVLTSITFRQTDFFK
jgi:hypothetical protein